MLLADAMDPAVATAAPDTTVRDVARVMRERRAGMVVLVSGASAVGVITDRDLALGVVAEGVPADRSAKAHASSPVVTIPVGAQVADALELMRRHGVSRIVVIDDGGRPAGLFGVAEAARAAGDR